MRILHVIDSLGRGGAETLVISIVKSLPDFEHYIITLDDKNDFNEELKGYDKIKITSLGNSRVWALPFNIWKLRNAIRRINPTIVHSQLYWSSVAAKIATPKRIKLFFTNQCLQRNGAFKKKWQVILEKVTYKKRHILISVSKAVEDEYREFIGIKGNHFILFNMADDVFFRGPKNYNTSEKISCISVGRLHSQKNQRFLLESFQHCSDQTSLDIFGAGPLEQELKKLRATLHLTNVNFKGVRKDMYNILPSYDLFIMSSLYEGFSLAVMEAMAAGLPVLLPDSAVFREMGGDAAIYFNLNDTYAIKRQLEKITPCLLTELSKKSFHRAVEIAGKSNYLNKLLRIYEIY